MTRLKQLRGSCDLRRYNPARLKIHRNARINVFLVFLFSSGAPHQSLGISRDGADQELRIFWPGGHLTVSPSIWDQAPSLMTLISMPCTYRGSKMSTLAFYVLMPYGCSGLVQTLIPRHSLFCLALGPRYARLAAGVSQRAASLPRRGGSSSRRGSVPF